MRPMMPTRSVTLIAPRANASDDAYALGDADSSARIEDVEQVGALESQFVSRQQGKAPLLHRAGSFIRHQCVGSRKQGLRFRFVEAKMLPKLGNLGRLEV